MEKKELEFLRKQRFLRVVEDLRNDLNWWRIDNIGNTQTWTHTKYDYSLIIFDNTTSIYLVKGSPVSSNYETLFNNHVKTFSYQTTLKHIVKHIKKLEALNAI